MVLDGGNPLVCASQLSGYELHRPQWHLVWPPSYGHQDGPSGVRGMPWPSLLELRHSLLPALMPCFACYQRYHRHLPWRCVCCSLAVIGPLCFKCLSDLQRQ